MRVKETQHLHGLNHLRALAILLVLLYHYWTMFPHPEWTKTVGRFGWVGVDLFFVLSGYLIASQLFRYIKEKNRINFKEFYIKRFFRILPAYFIVLTLYFTVPAFKEREGLAPLWKFLTFTQNLGLDLRTQRAFSHAWSLCIEEQFYLIFPLVLCLPVITRKWKLLMGLLIFLFVGTMLLRLASWNLFLVPLENDPVFGFTWVKYIYYPTYNRLDSIVVGVVLALITEFFPKAKEFLHRYYLLFLLTGLSIFTLSYFICKEQVSFNASIFGFSLVAISFGCITSAALSPSCFLYKYGSRVTEIIALLSYSSYLLHKAIIHLTQDFLLTKGLAPESTSVFWISMATTFAASGILYLFIEKPFLKIRSAILSKMNPFK
jgi:peptidoglycan/LPS O-acetylase OafA/YrhL